MPFVDFSTSGQDTQGQLKVFSAQFCWHFGFALLRALSYKKDPGRLCFSCSLLCFGNYTFFQRQGRLPPAATKSVRSISSFTVESLLLSAWEQVRHGRGWPRCAPQGLLLLWGALEGLGRLSSRLSTARRARLVFRTRRRLGHRGLRLRRARQRFQSQYGVYLGTAPRHIWVQSLSGRACCAMGVGLLLRPSQLCSLLSCYQALAQGQWISR